MVIAPLVLGRTIIATVWAMLAGVQVNPGPLKNDRAKGKKKEVVDHWWPIGVPGKMPEVCEGKKKERNGSSAVLGGSFYFASSRSGWLLIIGF